MTATEDVPRYLVDMVTRPGDDTHRRDWVGRRCSRHLKTIWVGLQAYTNSPLATAKEWDSAIDTVVLQRWYNRVATAGAQHAIHNRWIRYTLNRLMLATTSDRTIRIIKHHGSRRGDTVIPLRMSQFQDIIITNAIESSARSWTARECYVLRRFVASFPIWDFKRMAVVSPPVLRWWVQERMPLVVPHGHTRWFPAALEALLAWFLPPSSEAAAEAPFRPPASLLYPASEGLDVGHLMPYHCAVFFRHYFRADALAWVKDMARIFRFSGCTHIHIRQMWDECKDFWLFHCRGHGECFATDVTPRITEASVREWLVDVHRRAGGGMRLTPVCIKALSSLRFMMQTDTFAMLGLRASGLSRTQYLGMVQRVCAREEPNHLLDPPVRNMRNQRPFPSGRTYRDEECERLLASCTTDRDRLIMLLLQRVALRNTALRTLRVCNLLDPATGLVRGVCEAAEKGGTVRRFCLDPDTVKCLMDYIHKEHPQTNTVATAWMFPRSVTELDTCISPSQMHWWFKKQCHAAKIHGPHCTIHQFRHYVVTKLMTHGSNRIEDVSMWLGHTSVHTTCAHYWIVDVSDLHRRLVFPWASPEK